MRRSDWRTELPFGLNPTRSDSIIVNTPTMTDDNDRLYVIHFPLTHPTFRIPALRSVADQYDVPLKFYPLPGGQDEEGAEQTQKPSTSTISASSHGTAYSPQAIRDSWDASYDPQVESGRPFAIVSLRSDEDALLLLKKCTVVRSICHLWAAGVAPEHTITALRHPSSQQLYAPYAPDQYSWKADVIVVGFKISYEEKNQRIESCRVMGFEGPVSLSRPDFEWAWMEERWGITGGYTQAQEKVHDDQVNAHRLTFVGRKIPLDKTALAREWIERLDLKKRSYIGNTSMEAEMSLNLAQMAQAAPGKLVYDPFVGTGSLLIACAALGAYVMGSDIDGRMIRGKKAREDPSAQTGIITAAIQYGLRDKFLDCLTFDITQHPWRLAMRDASQGAPDTGLLDAIVGDPPYGVRAGAKRLGQRDTRKNTDTPIWLEDRQGYAHEQEDYIPPTRPYALNDLLSDLLTFASRLLKDDGRLVFWMPVMNEDSQTTAVPTGLEWDVVAVSTQDFGRWARRLVTLRRLPRAQVAANQLRPAATDDDALTRQQTQFHAGSGRYRANVDETDFRNKYFGPTA